MPIPADEDGNRDMPERAAEHAASYLAEVNKKLKAKEKSPLTFDSDVFDCDGHKRFHCYGGKQCYAIVQKEREEQGSGVGAPKRTSRAAGAEPGALAEKRMKPTPPTEAEVAAAAAAALQQAEAEGLELLLAPGTIVGYAGVVLQHKAVRFPYRAQIPKDGRSVGLGTFICAEEAALCYSRALGAEGIARRKAERSEREAAAPTDEEILAQAASEGLELIPKDNIAGYRGVSANARNKSKPFQASIYRQNKETGLGSFPSAAAAALAYARALRDADVEAGADADASNATCAADAREMFELAKLTTPAAVAAQAEAEGLELTPAVGGSLSGYKGVVAQRSTANGGRIRGYTVITHANGVAKQRGRSLVLAEQAALYYARCVKRDQERDAAARAAAAEAAAQQSMAGLLAASLVS